MKNVMSWDEGLLAAERVIGLLAGCYTRLAVAGSIRRGKAEVGDVELVASGAVDPMTGEKLMESRLNELVTSKTISLQTKSNGALKSWADRQRSFEFEGVPVDLFVVQPDRQWGPTMVLRTGPGPANTCMMVPYSDARGCSPHDVMWRDGSLWKLPRPYPIRVKDMDLPEGSYEIDCPEEVDVFRAMGLPWLPPQSRRDEQYNATAWVQREGPGLSKWWVKWMQRDGITVDEVRDPAGRPMWPTVIKSVEVQQSVQQMEMM